MQRISGCGQSSVKPEKQSQRSKDWEFGTSASSGRTDLGFCALTIVFVRTFGLLSGGYPCFYSGPGPRGRLLGNDDRVTAYSEDNCRYQGDCPHYSITSASVRGTSRWL